MRFHRCVSNTELKHVIGHEMVTVVYQYDCCCFDNSHRPVDFCMSICGESITVDDIFKCLQLNGFDPMCNHRFFEGTYDIAPGIIGLMMSP